MVSKRNVGQEKIVLHSVTCHSATASKFRPYVVRVVTVYTKKHGLYAIHVISESRHTRNYSNVNIEVLKTKESMNVTDSCSVHGA